MAGTSPSPGGGGTPASPDNSSAVVDPGGSSGPSPGASRSPVAYSQGGDATRSQQFVIPNLDRGMNTNIAPRQMWRSQDGPIYASAWNVDIHNGGLEARPNLFGITSVPSIVKNGSWNKAYGGVQGIDNGQCAMAIIQNAVLSRNIAGSTSQVGETGYTICVTSKQIWINSSQDGNWYDATPTYTTGNVDTTSGSPTVTGHGTTWLAKGITKGQLLRVGINTYSIKAVVSDTSITLASNALANISGGAYSIVRTFGGRNYMHPDNRLWARVFNGDLYIAGRTLAGYGIGPAVIRVQSVADAVFTTEYLLANIDLTGTMAAAGSVIANVWDMIGLVCLQDGRIGTATWEIPANRTGIAGNRFRYSSHLDQKQWVATPGGFTDLVGRDGGVTGLAQFRDKITAHFRNGIMLGEPTGQQDPPLSWSVSRAVVGAISALAVVEQPDFQYFIGSDSRVYALGGTYVVEQFPVYDQSFSFPASNIDQLMYSTTGCYDSYRKELTFFVNYNDGYLLNQTGTQYSTAYRFNLEKTALLKNNFNFEVTAIGYPDWADPGAGATTGPAAFNSFGPRYLYGVGSFDITVSGGSTRDLLYSYDETKLNSGSIDAPTSSDTPSSNPVIPNVTFDQLDFGQPGVDKTIDYIEFVVHFAGAQKCVWNMTATVTGVLTNTSETRTTAFNNLPTGTPLSVPMILTLPPMADESFVLNLTFSLQGLPAVIMQFDSMAIAYRLGGETRALASGIILA